MRTTRERKMMDDAAAIPRFPIVESVIQNGRVPETMTMIRKMHLKLRALEQTHATEIEKKRLHIAAEGLDVLEKLLNTLVELSQRSSRTTPSGGCYGRKN
ncbi:hypothetical protein JXA80_11600 [bacterium]|nr:hypothetical protein [candidate division CSSED10-310 bacterium]